jgi:hypothetical protein
MIAKDLAGSRKKIAANAEVRRLLVGDRPDFGLAKWVVSSRDSGKENRGVAEGPRLFRLHPH